MTIALSITENYCPTWKHWEAVREIGQNAADADDEGYKMTVVHRGTKLTFTNAGVVLDPRILLLGGTMGKSENARGKYREGLKISLLALRRLGCAVTIYTGDEMWRPEIEPSEQFAGEKILVIHTRKLRIPREDFIVEIQGIEKEVWGALKKRFLFLQKPDPTEVISTDQGDILLNETYRGCLFSRGIYVCTVPKLDQGYDLKYLQLDRDRQVVDSWDLRYKLADLWAVASVQHADRAIPKIYKMAQAGDTEELQALKHFGSASLAARLRTELEKEYGIGVVPVSGMGDAQEVESLGAKAVVVDRAFQDLLEKDGNTIAKTKETQRRGIRARIGPTGLDATERAVLNEVIGKVVDLNAVQIVEYNDPETKGHYDAESRVLQFSRAALALPKRDLMKMAVAQASLYTGKEGDTIYLDLLFPEEPEHVATPEVHLMRDD